METMIQTPLKNGPTLYFLPSAVNSGMPSTVGRGIE